MAQDKRDANPLEQRRRAELANRYGQGLVLLRARAERRYATASVSRSIQHARESPVRPPTPRGSRAQPVALRSGGNPAYGGDARAHHYYAENGYRLRRDVRAPRYRYIEIE